ncbi:hypothetical protein RAS1_00480 [Phycisphaerae bacterium RAS1]|nr:hypothetical protein RAS1_00480 [Phycisphaerae bacterium RAS1]
MSREVAAPPPVLAAPRPVAPIAAPAAAAVITRDDRGNDAAYAGDDWDDANLHAPPPDSPDYADEATASSDVAVQSSPAAPADGPGAPGAVGVSSEDRLRVLKDPLVQQVMELFDATLTNLRRTNAGNG